MVLPALMMMAVAQGAGGLSNVLSDLNVEVDDKPAQLGPVYGEGDAYYVDAGKLTAALSDGRAVFHHDGGVSAIFVDGQKRITFEKPTFGSGPQAVIRPVGYAAPITIDLESVPEQDAKGGWDIDLADADRLFGAQAEIDTLTIRLTTPEYYANRMGIQPQAFAGLNARSVGAGLAFGITPPAKDMVIWCRTPGDGNAQMYKFGASATLPMIGMDGNNNQIDQPSNDDYIHNIHCGQKDPVRVTTSWTRTEDSSDTGFGYYACIVIPKSDPRGKDDAAIDIANSGTDHSWFLIGGRQKRLDSPLGFSLKYCTTSLTAIAKSARMDLELLRKINGLTGNETLTPHDRVLILSSVEGKPPAPIPTKLYEVKRGDSIRGLAASWQIDPEKFFAINPDLLAGQALVEGQIVNAPEAASLTGPVATVKEFTGRARGTTLVYTSSSLKGDTLGSFVPGDFVAVTHEVEPNAYRVVWRDREGFVNRAAVQPDAVQPNTGPANETKLQLDITAEALKHIGTRYVWGGNNLTSGIDCSHFVAAVLNRAGMADVPSPPVLHQEQVGVKEHHKIGPYLQGGPNVLEFRDQVPVTALRPGDRIIIQWDPLNNRTGGRHTGIFIGKYQNLKFAVVHASSSKGVTVTNLLNTWLWKGYRYAVRDRALQ